MPLGYGKAWIKGSVSDNETVDAFESEYNTQQGEWLQMIIKANAEENVISTVYHRLKVENILSKHLGPKYASVTLNAGRPDVYVTTINSTSSPEEYVCIKKNMGPYKALQSSCPAAQTATQVAAPTIQDLITLTKSKDDRLEN